METQERVKSNQPTYELRIGSKPDVRVFHNWTDAFWSFGKERVRCSLVQVFHLNGKVLRIICRRKDSNGNVSF